MSENRKWVDVDIERRDELIGTQNVIIAELTEEIAHARTKIAALENELDELKRASDRSSLIQRIIQLIRGDRS